MAGEKSGDRSRQQRNQSGIDARARQICATGLITRVADNQFRVPSQSRRGKYYDVSIADEGSCTCPYYAERHEECKHIVAARNENEACCRSDAAGADAAGADAAGADAAVPDGGADGSGQSQCRLSCKCRGVRCRGIPAGGKRCGCRCRCRRDPKAYDYVTEAGRIQILMLIMELIDAVGIVPYELGVGFGGQRGYDPKRMFAVIVLKTLARESCRGMAGYLRDHPDLCRSLGLPSIPSRNSVARAYKKVSAEYIRTLVNLTTAEIEIGDVATDSSGFGRKLYELWSTVKKADGLRKGYLKLHILIDIGTRMIIDLRVTKSNVSDILVFREFLETFDWSKCKGGFMCADAAYLARDVCTAIARLGYLPRIMPKKNTIPRAKGSAAWRDMVLFYQKAYKEFIKEYGRRSIVESVFGSIKQVYGNSLTMRLPESQETEMMIEALCHNATHMCRHRFAKNGSPYPDQPRLEQYRRMGLDSNRRIADTGPTVQDAVSELIEQGILQKAPGQDEEDVARAIRAIRNRYDRPLFYPKGSCQYKAVQDAIAAAGAA